MSVIIIEHEDPNLPCIHQLLCDKLFEHDQIFVPLPAPKYLHPNHFDMTFQQDFAKPINLLDIKQTKKIIGYSINVILEGTVSLAINEQLKSIQDEDIRRLSIGINHPQTIINLSPIDEMIDVHALNQEQITDKLVEIILSNSKNTT